MSQQKIEEFEQLLNEIIKLEQEIVKVLTNVTKVETGKVMKYSNLFDEQYRKKLILIQMYKEAIK